MTSAPHRRNSFAANAAASSRSKNSSTRTAPSEIRRTRAAGGACGRLFYATFGRFACRPRPPCRRRCAVYTAANNRPHGCRPPGDAMTLPLAGVLILDLADEPLGARRPLARGPWRRCRPCRGRGRRRPPPARSWVGGEPGVERGLAHLLYNAGKRSVALDLAHSAAPSRSSTSWRRRRTRSSPMEPHPTVAALLAEERLRAIAPRANVVDAVLRRDATAPGGYRGDGRGRPPRPRRIRRRCPK